MVPQFFQQVSQICSPIAEFICILLFVSDETDRSGQPESVYIGAGIGGGAVIILLVLVIIVIVVWLKRAQNKKIKKR